MGIKYKKTAEEILRSLAAILLALVIGAVFILVSGESPLTAYGALLKGALGSPQAIANSISKSVPWPLPALPWLWDSAAACSISARRDSSTPGPWRR